MNLMWLDDDEMPEPRPRKPRSNRWRLPWRRRPLVEAVCTEEAMPVLAESPDPVLAAMGICSVCGGMNGFHNEQFTGRTRHPG